MSFFHSLLLLCDKNHWRYKLVNLKGVLIFVLCCIDISVVGNHQQSVYVFRLRRKESDYDCSLEFHRHLETAFLLYLQEFCNLKNLLGDWLSCSARNFNIKMFRVSSLMIVASLRRDDEHLCPNISTTSISLYLL